MGSQYSAGRRCLIPQGRCGRFDDFPVRVAFPRPSFIGRSKFGLHLRSDTNSVPERSKSEPMDKSSRSFYKFLNRCKIAQTWHNIYNRILR